MCYFTIKIQERADNIEIDRIQFSTKRPPSKSASQYDGSRAIRVLNSNPCCGVEEMNLREKEVNNVSWTRKVQVVGASSSSMCLVPISEHKTQFLEYIPKDLHAASLDLLHCASNRRVFSESELWWLDIWNVWRISTWRLCLYLNWGRGNCRNRCDRMLRLKWRRLSYWRPEERWNRLFIRFGIASHFFCFLYGWSWEESFVLPLD